MARKRIGPMTPEQLKRSEAAIKGAERRRRRLVAEQERAKRKKRSEAAKKAWEKRKKKNPRAARNAALKGWRTRRDTPEVREKRKILEIDKLKRQLEQEQIKNREQARRLYILENSEDIQSEHAEFLDTFRGTKGYGLTMAVQEIFLEYLEIYDEIGELYELYNTTEG